MDVPVRYRKDGRLDLRFRGAASRQALLDSIRAGVASTARLGLRSLPDRAGRLPPQHSLPDRGAETVPAGAAGSTRSAEERLATLTACVTASFAWSVVASVVLVVLTASAIQGKGLDGAAESTKPPPGFIVFLAGSACWWIARAIQTWGVRRAIAAGQLGADLGGTRAAAGRAWLLLEGVSTIIPGSCCIGPPLLVLAVLGNRIGASPSQGAAAVPPSPLAPADGDPYRATTEWTQRRV